MGMHIDSTGKHVFPGGIDDLARIVARQTLPDGRDLSLRDCDITCVGIGSGDHRPLVMMVSKPILALSPPLTENEFYAKLPALTARISRWSRAHEVRHYHKT